ncbi:FHA domain-containing protein [Sorangium sp. So ce1099]|uniref:FHA domain-containing protein n=1 Tax=Sorangium sp. So ce1099 TaxID=3133331 RepID=UPI003F621EF3
MSCPDDSTITAQPPADRLTLSSNKICVEIVHGPDAGAIVELPGPEARVGSDPGCDLQLKDRKVSRLHLVLSIERDRIRVTDPGSRNGTTVDGVWSSPASVDTPDGTRRQGWDGERGGRSRPSSRRRRYGWRRRATGASARWRRTST